ncbi:MAG: Crp/Fnr family transcriptional regulator [Bacteroidota bacterium]
MENAYQIFKDTYPFLKETDIDQLRAKSKVLILKKKEYWQKGPLNFNLAFIVDGAVRAFFIDEKGNEISSIIRTAQQTIITPGTAHFEALNPAQSTKQAYYAQAVIESRLIEIPASVFLSLCQENERIFQLFLINISSHIGALLMRVENLITLNPEDRVKFLVEQKQHLLDNIPHKYLADYVGITSVSLSRILKRLTKD